MVHPFWHPSAWAGMEPQSRSDPRAVCWDGISGLSLAHPAQSRQDMLLEACSAEYSLSNTNPEMSQSRQHREVQNLLLKQLIKQLTCPTCCFSKH